jgi:DeoR family transcriptional regulator, glycerol-3-phosphate regulon repressor
MSQRAREILDILNETGSARTQEIAARLGVTPETIRRTAAALEHQGLVTKVHGGVSLKNWGLEPSFAQRIVQNQSVKRRIGEAVAGLISDGASLFLDVGSTTAYVAQALRERHDLLVVTNSLPVAQALAGQNGNRVFMAGGELRPHDGGAFGAEARAFVRQFRVRHAILSVAGVDAKAGFLLQDLPEAEFSRTIIACADEAIIAADASKFGRAAPIRIADPQSFHRLVTDALPPPDIEDMLAEAGISVTLAA